MVKLSLSWALQLDTFTNGSKVDAHPSGLQNHPKDDWVHLFTDGAVARALGNASIGGVVCD